LKENKQWYFLHQAPFVVNENKMNIELILNTSGAMKLGVPKKMISINIK